MNIFEARDNAGKRVKYTGGRVVKYGTITGFSNLTRVFVKFDESHQAKEVDPHDLELV